MITIAGYEFQGPVFSETVIPPRQGVYVVLRMLNKMVVDVGESGNMQTRLLSHDRKPMWAPYGPLVYAYFPTIGYDAESRRMIERQVRMQYNPPCGVY